MNDLSEKEQLDEMRAWWAENGRFVIIGLALGVAIIVGWNQWRSSITNTRLEASVLFESVMDAVQAGDVDAAETAAANMFADYGNTVYPGQTRLAMARLYMDKGRDQDAARVLRELVDLDDGSEIAMVSRLRLAKVLLYQNKPEEVVTLLRGHDTGGFAAKYSEILGDAYAALGRIEEAQAAYSKALLENATVQTIDSDLMQLKLNDLPDPNELAATSVAIEAAIDAGGVVEVADGTAEAPANSGDSGMEVEAEADSEPVE